MAALRPPEVVCAINGKSLMTKHWALMVVTGWQEMPSTTDAKVVCRELGWLVLQTSVNCLRNIRQDKKTGQYVHTQTTMHKCYSAVVKCHQHTCTSYKSCCKFPFLLHSSINHLEHSPYLNAFSPNPNFFPKSSQNSLPPISLQQPLVINSSPLIHLH